MTAIEVVIWFLVAVWGLLIVALIVGIVVEKGKPTHKRNTIEWAQRDRGKGADGERVR